MHIGFIGLGQMGTGMVRALLRAGQTVTVFNRTRSKAEALASAGARVANEPRETLGGDAVVTMLADDAAVSAIAHAILPELPARTVHVSSSTISPALVRELAGDHRARGRRFVSVPMLGRPDVAEQGKLFAIAAGDRRVLDELRPMLDAMAQRTIVVGDAPEAANIVKLACNTLIATIIEALGETSALVAKSGVVERSQFFDVLLATVLSAPTFRPYGEHVRDGSFAPGFRLPLALKDIELVLGTAREHEVAMPVVSVIRDHMLEAMAAGLGELDWGALALVSRRAAGLDTRS
jgi:3-hydroxyisobutyrate dehydrogenase-like beta-hydroxyacid dehydrogenase